MRPRLAGILAATFLLAALGAQAQVVGNITVSIGPVDLFPAGQQKAVAAKQGADVRIGDRLETGAGGRVKIFMTMDNSVVQIGEETIFVIDDLEYSETEGVHRAFFRLLKGKARVIINKIFGVDADAKIETPTAVAGVTGTSLIVGYDVQTAQSLVLTLDGTVKAWNPNLRRTVVRELTTGRISYIAKGRYATEARNASPTVIEELLKATEVPGPPPTDLDSLDDKNLTDDPVGVTRKGEDDSGPAEPGDPKAGQRDEDPELEPAGPEYEDPGDLDDDDFGDDDDDQDADVDVGIDFPEESETSINVDFPDDQQTTGDDDSDRRNK